MRSVVDIMKRIPHRFPFLLVDRVLDCKVNASIICLKNVTYNEGFFEGHFPGAPVLPGVLQLEMMAQAAAILQSETIISEGGETKSKLFLFTGVENAKFLRPVVPGDSVLIKAALLRKGSLFAKFECSCNVDDKEVSKATITATMVNNIDGKTS